MNKSSGVVGDGLFERARGNPLLTPERWPYQINAVMNAGATMVGDDTVLLCRVEDRRGISHLTVARSRDGVSNWVVDDHPLLAPSPDHPEEEWGVEDPRVTRVDELDCWVIAYTAFGPGGPAVSLATTRDFVSVERLGPVFPPEDKNASLLPRRVGGRWEIAMLTAYGVVAAYLYGLLMNLSGWPFLLGIAIPGHEQTALSFDPSAPLWENLHRFGAYTLITSTGSFDTGRAITNAIAIVVVGPAVLTTLRRAARRATVVGVVVPAEGGP
jgi:hypothetical protein